MNNRIVMGKRREYAMEDPMDFFSADYTTDERGGHGHECMDYYGRKRARTREVHSKHGIAIGFRILGDYLQLPADDFCPYVHLQGSYTPVHVDALYERDEFLDVVGIGEESRGIADLASVDVDAGHGKYGGEENDPPGGEGRLDHIIVTKQLGVAIPVPVYVTRATLAVVVAVT